MNQTLLTWEKRLACFLLFTTPFVVSPITVDSYILPKLTWVFLWGALWLFLAAIQSSFKLKSITAMDWPLLALTLLAVISIANDYHSPNQLHRLLILLLYIGFFYVFRRYWSYGGCIHPVAKTMLVSLTILAIYGIAQDYGYDLFSPTGGVRDWRAKVIATLGNPNFLSGYLLIGLPVLIGYTLQHRATIKRFLPALLGITLIVACHTVTFCVGSTLGLTGSLIALALTLIYLKRKPRLPLFRTALVVILAFSAAAWYLLDNPWNSHGGSLYKEAMQSPQWWSGTGARQFNWRTTGYMIDDEPLTGIGFGNYKDKHLHYQGINYQIQDHPHDRDYVVLVDQPHFLVLEFASEMGPLGVFVLFWLLVTWVKQAILQLRNDNNQWFAWGAYAGCWVAIIHSFASFPFHLPANALLFTALASYLCKNKSTPSVTHIKSNIAKIVLFICATLLAVQAYLQYTSNQSLRLSYETQGLDSYVHLQTAHRLNPFDPQVHLMLGTRAIELGWYDRAIEHLNNTLDLQVDLRAHKYLARIYLEQGNLQQAIEQHRRIIELNAAYPGHYRDLAELLRQIGNTEEAQTLEQKAAEMQARLEQQ